MTHSSDRASNARNNVNPNTNQENTMRKPNKYLCVVALMGTTLTMNACSQEAPTGVFTPPEVTLKALYTEDCEDAAVDPKPDFCTTPLEVTRKMMVGDTDGDASKEVDKVTIEVGRLAGALEATETFDPYPIAAGQYAEMHFSFNVTVPDGYELQSCDGGPRPSIVKDLDVEEVCVKFAKTDNGGNGNNTGSGTGDVCLEAEDTDGMSVDLAPCTVKLNGNVVSGDEDTDGVCPNGMFLDDLDAKNHNFNIECPDNLEGSINTGVAEDKVTPVIVLLEDSTVDPGEDPTTLCLHIGMSNGDPVNVANCDVTDIAHSPNPLTPAAAPMGVCQDNDALYFEGIKAGERQYNVVCNEGNVLVPFTIQANVLNDKEVFYAPAGTPGDPCYKDIGDHVDVYGMTLPLQAKLGHYDNTGTVCVLEPNLVDYEDFSVTAMTDNGNCLQLGDPACLIDVMGAVNDPLFQNSWYQHLVLETTPADLQTLPAEGKRTHFVTLEDGDAKTVIVPVVVKNGVVQDL